VTDFNAQSRAETCEHESPIHYVMGEIPVFADDFERVAGGPSNPDYYDLN
jgi:hypothetical protein